MENNRENFGSKIGAILAAAGSAVGLGNVWRFPIETGQNGGAAFIIIYVACIVVLGLPIMISEFLIGRHTHMNTAGAYRELSNNGIWKWVGRLGVFSGWFILCYYGVVGGWTLHYTVLSAADAFSGVPAKEYENISKSLPQALGCQRLGLSCLSVSRISSSLVVCSRALRNSPKL